MRSNTSPDAATVAERLAAFGLAVPDEAAAHTAAYLALLMKWNKAMNLVGASTWQAALDGLVADSFHLAAFLAGPGFADAPETWDLGAGAGLPGIPLRTVWQRGRYTLVEPREKRALFMRTFLAAVPLPRTVVFEGRAEAFFSGAPVADLVISRAFMPWPRMLDFVRPHIAPDARVVFLASAPLPEALPPSWKALRVQTYAANGKTRYFWCLTQEA